MSDAAPLAIDLYAGLGGWTEGLLAEGWRVIGFDTERHEYGEHKYPAQLVIQDVLTLHGSQFRDADLIVASPPCQAYSYRAMPWSRARALPPPDNALFDACFRIQREACEAAGRHIPLIVENVRGAQKWVGRSRWNFGSFHLWGDVPALMPMTQRAVKSARPNKEGVMAWTAGHLEGYWERSDGAKNPGFRFDGSGRSMQSESVDRHIKNTGGSWFNIGSPGQKVTNQNPVHALSGIKGSDGYERDHPNALGWKKPRTSSHSQARKAASAMIAKIPFVLSSYIARTFHPRREAA